MGNYVACSSIAKSNKILIQEVKYSILNGNDTALKLALRKHINLHQQKDFIFFLLRSAFILPQYIYQRVFPIIDESDEIINLDWNLKSPGEILNFRTKKYKTTSSDIYKDHQYVYINGIISQLYINNKQLVQITTCDDLYYEYNVTYKKSKGLSVDAYINYLRDIARKYYNNKEIIDTLNYLDTYIYNKRKKLSVLSYDQPLPSSRKDKNVSNTCSICGDREINTIYNCGHVTNCKECAQTIETCPICRENIITRIDAYIASFD